MLFKASFKLVLTALKWVYVDIPMTGNMYEYCIFIRGRIIKRTQKPLEIIIIFPYVDLPFYTKEIKIE